ncbi:hypothetical protein QTO34_006274 [Cnephaeus nilssonii]|uniref:Uncharacterized protein n=1 Tax=Cnephaeus nilssonii TaxID=3371016 RepID=A0AA40LIG2_CNENI|nr:hypothetical protein QTO34_006274 [Eptesicus nilssonii]
MWLFGSLSVALPQNTMAGRVYFEESLGHTTGPRVKSLPTHMCLKIMQDPDLAAPPPPPLD